MALLDRLAQRVAGFANKNDAYVASKALSPLYAAQANQIFNSAGLAVGSTTTKVKIANLISGIVAGNFFSKAITDDAFTLSGVVADGKTNVFCFYLDAAGTASSAMGIEATTTTAGHINKNIVFPDTPADKVLLGFVTVSASGGAFTGGTSNVATAGNFTVTFVNTVGPIALGLTL